MGMKKTDHDVRPTPMWAKAMIVGALAVVVLGSAYVWLLMPRARGSDSTVAPLPQVSR